MPIYNANTRGATGLCLEPHDLLISKYVAGREKDYRFISDALRYGLVEAPMLEARLATTELDEERRARIRERIAYDLRSSKRG